MSVTVPCQVGSFRVHAVEAGRFRLDGGAMFGVVPKPLWERKIPADERNRIPLAMRCLLLQGFGRTILVDAGIGDKFDDKFAEIYAIDVKTQNLIASLQRHGVDPDEVTDVILTHLHFDHCGGATQQRGNSLTPTFPNATYHVQRAHWQWACNPNPREKASFLCENFKPLEDSGSLNLLDGDTELLDGLHIIVVHGHTRSMQLVKLTDGGNTLFYASDLVPTAAHVPLPWVMAYDVEPLRTIEEKELILGQAADEGWIVFLEHDPTTAAIRVERDGLSFKVASERL